MSDNQELTKTLTEEILIAKYSRISASWEMDHPIVINEQEQAREIAEVLIGYGWVKRQPEKDDG